MGLGSVVGSIKISGAISFGNGGSYTTYSVPANCYAIININTFPVSNNGTYSPPQYFGPGQTAYCGPGFYANGVLFTNSP